MRRTIPKTKIVCTIGPASESPDILKELVLEGMHQHSMLSRERTDGTKSSYKDMLESMLSGVGDD